MLNFFREKAQSPSIQVTILIIIIVFIFWGVGRNNRNNRNAVATVNGTSIEYQDYQKAYEQTLNRLRDQFGGAIPKGLLDSLDIKHQVLNQLIQQTLLRQGALKAGLYVSDQELQEAIEKMPAFQQNGIFNLELYKNILASSRLTVSKFESGMRYNLLATKVMDHLSRFGQVSPSELKNLFNYKYTSVRFSYASFNALNFTDKVVVTKDKLTAFFNKHKDNYHTNPERKIKYLLFSFKDQQEPMPDKAEIEQYYARNIAKYSTPERRKARHILILSKSSDSPEKKAAERKKIESILAKAKAGENFADLAKRYSQDSLASRGGELGYFRRGQMVKPFENAAFSLKEGEISGVVKTQFGFHIIKLEKIEPAKTKTLQDVKQEIIAKLKQEKAKDNAFKEANDAYEQIILSGSLEKYAAAKTNGKPSAAPIISTGFFAQQNPPEELKSLPALVNTAFTLKKDELSSIVEDRKGYAIVYVEDIKPPVQQKLAQVTNQVKKDLIAQESVKLAQEAAAKMLAELKHGGKFKEISQKDGVEMHTTPYISRADSTAAKLPEQVIKQAMRLSAESPLPKEAIADGRSFYVISFKESKKPEPALFAKQKSALEKQVSKENNDELLTAWVTYLEKNAEITTNEKLL